MPCDYKNYPKNWKDIRSEILLRAQNQCEWIKRDESPGSHYYLRCAEANGHKAIWFDGRVVLTIAHLCFKTKCVDRKHLMAMCQLHHNQYDATHRAANRKKTMQLKVAPHGEGGEK